MTAQDEFQKLIDCEGIRYFDAKEVFFRGGSNARLQTNTDPPRELWPNIIPTLRVLDALRVTLGVPIELTSIYRSPAYNRNIGGEKASFHMRFQACDFKAMTGKPKEWAAELLDMRRQGVFKGGVGIYPTFIHVDTRGYNASW